MNPGAKCTTKLLKCYQLMKCSKFEKINVKFVKQGEEEFQRQRNKTQK